MSLWCDPGGYLRAVITTGADVREYSFQKLALREREFAKFALAWDEDERIRREGGEQPVPGNAGLAPHVPSVTEPRHHMRAR